MSPGQRKSPAGKPGSLKVIAATCTNDTPSVAASQPRHRPHPARCPHARTRWCRSCRYVRRVDSAALTALCRTTEQITPSTFSLEMDELRAHARDLWSAGWSPDEIEAVLAIERRSA